MKQYTTDEHYVPQTYLKNFAETKGSKMLWVYDKKYKTVQRKSVKSICYQKDLYEFKDQDGEYISRNFNEKALGITEQEFHKICEHIIKCATSENEGKIFLSTNEKAWISAMCVLQQLRSPIVLKASKIAAKECFGEIMCESDIHNLSLTANIPFTGCLNKSEDNLFTRWSNILFADAVFITYYVDKAIVPTSNNPIIIKSNENLESVLQNSVDGIVYPISSNVFIETVKRDNVNSKYRNRLIHADDDIVDYLYNSYAHDTNTKYIYTANELSEKYKNMICKNTQEN